MKKSITYLALGDSYTIGEQVPLFENFPYQTVQLLRKQFAEQQHFLAPEIVAKTGWTTDELQSQINAQLFLPQYDLVSLLIGVNNQYRGRSVENYKEEFKHLLKQAIGFAGGLSSRVFVLSIPDWGKTPFAAERDIQKIEQEINEYNQACEEIALAHHCHFINITNSQRADSHLEGFIAEDKLHPSGKEYAKWAEQLFREVVKEMEGD
jgi:lysophospholipase L1-like esterase